MLGRLGRPRDAVRALQAAARHPRTTEAAARRLCLELGALGLPHAADEIARRLHEAHPDLPDSAAAIAELELQARSGRVLSAEPLRRFGELRLIGAGTLGRVYQAEDRLLGETVVLKILAVGAGGSGEERLAFLRFVREAEAASRLHHPNVVRLRDVDERAGILVLEYLPGGTLATALAQHGRLDPPAVRRLALELLSALAATHRAGIVHRDVKPANVFFDAAGNAKLADFGASHLADFGGTQTAGFIGTLAYLSPEQISGAPIGPGADLYGLAVTLFEALTGRLPFLGPDIVGQHLSEPPPPASALYPGLSAVHDEVLLRALAKRPGDRYPSADAMAEAVRAWPATSQWPALRLPAARRRDPTPAPTPEPAHTGKATEVPTAVEPCRPRAAGPDGARPTVRHPRRARGPAGAGRGAGCAAVGPRQDGPDRPCARRGPDGPAGARPGGGPAQHRVRGHRRTAGAGRLVAGGGPGRPGPGFAALEATGIPLPDGRPVALGPAGPVIQVVAPGAPAYAAKP